MFNVFYYQTPSLLPVMSIVFTSPWQTLDKSVVVVILNCIMWLKMCYTTTNHMVQPTWTSLQPPLYSWRWLRWILLWYLWRRTRSQAMVLLLCRVQLSRSLWLYSWGKSKCQVTHIMATSWEVLHSNLTFTHTQCTSIEEIKTNNNVKSDLSMCLV